MEVKTLRGKKIPKEVKCTQCFSDLIIEIADIHYEDHSETSDWCTYIEDVNLDLVYNLSNMGITKEGKENLKKDFLKIQQRFPKMVIYPQGNYTYIKTFVKCPICGSKTYLSDIETFNEIRLTTGHTEGKMEGFITLYKKYGLYTQYIYINPSSGVLGKDYENFFKKLGYNKLNLN